MKVNQALVKSAAKAEFFTPQYWQKKGQQTGSAGGRNLAYFVAANNELTELPMVLRHYYRGGLVGRFNKDWFLGLGATRADKEFDLLQWMHERDLPVPRPIACYNTRVGPFYRSDILIEQLPCDADLCVLLQKQVVADSAWQAVGQAIAQMHALQVFHSDLNCHNIVLRVTDSKVWLIDFDKCEQREGDAWKEENIARLRRSFDKEKGLHSTFNFSEDDWQKLLHGYQLGQAEPNQAEQK